MKRLVVLFLLSACSPSPQSKVMAAQDAVRAYSETPDAVLFVNTHVGFNGEVCGLFNDGDGPHAFTTRGDEYVYVSPMDCQSVRAYSECSIEDAGEVERRVARCEAEL